MGSHPGVTKAHFYLPCFSICFAFDMPSSLCSITVSHWYQLRGLCLFLCLGHVGAMIAIDLHVVNIVVSQRTEWLEERKRNEGTISHQSRTYNIDRLSLPSYMGRVHSATK